MIDPGPKRSSKERSEQDTPDDPERRAALKAVQKYAVFVAGTSTVILSADEALAQQDFCSRMEGRLPPRIYEMLCGDGTGPGRGGGRGRPNRGWQRFNRGTDRFRRQ